MNQTPRPYRSLWLAATIICALYLIVIVASSINKMISVIRYGRTDTADWIFYSTNILPIILILGFLLVLYKKPGIGGMLIIVYSIAAMIFLLSPYAHSLAGASLVIPLLAAGVLFVIYWHKNRLQRQP